MSHKYKYDESGLASSYLILALLFPVTLYVTFRHKRALARINCPCTGCIAKTKQSGWKTKTIVSILWLLVAILIKNILTLKTVSISQWSPFSALEISEDATEKEIKSSFRRLSRKYNPDQADQSKKKEYEEKTIEIGSAYNILKDKNKKEEWLLGQSGPREEVVAIPEWVISRGYMVLAIYAIILGILFPYWALRKWKRNSERNLLGVYYETMEKFYEDIKGDLICKDEYSTIRGLINIFIKTKEFREHKWKINSEVKDLIENNFGIPLRTDIGEGSYKGYLVLMDHLFRTNKSDLKDRMYVQESTLALINGVRRIAIIKNLPKLVSATFTFEKMVIQAIFDPEYAVMQYPGVKFINVLLEPKKNELEFVKEAGSPALFVYQNLPRVKINKFIAFVRETGAETEDLKIEDLNEFETPKEINHEKNNNMFTLPTKALTTILVELERIENVNSTKGCYDNKKSNSIELGSDGIGFVLKQQGEIDLSLINSIGTYKNVAVHAPYLINERCTSWSVMLMINDQMHSQIPTFSDFQGTKKIYFEIPEKPSSCEDIIKIGIISNSYFNVDVTESITVKYVTNF
ncbi:Protein translocation protein SEC63 [Astathelohania contejeani]|uniref:Protein translocation protein SEC63 n=1 Tax=Astathelohania contejeani TaxID=164912 RepID=A0ABQ7I290_9MICR|nr:Protein translocation protein SEC63 [Thelohania contejeani]